MDKLNEILITNIANLFKMDQAEVVDSNRTQLKKKAELLEMDTSPFPMKKLVEVLEGFIFYIEKIF